MPIKWSVQILCFKWQKEQLKALGVTIHLQKAVTADILQKDKPDVLVIATGSHPAIAPIQGVEQPWVVTGHDILSGHQQAGERVVVIGGGLVGAETAEFLAYHGSNVTILEALSQIAKDGEDASNLYMMNNLATHQVKIYTEAKVLAIGDHTVTFTHQGQTHNLTAVDTVVMATGAKSDRELDDCLNDTRIQVVKIGDAAKVKNGLANIREGFDVGINL